MKIVVVGLGYVGLSNAVLLAQYNEVVVVDISKKRSDALNAWQSPIIDAQLSKYLAKKDLNLSASTDLEASLRGADYVIVSTPISYDEKTNFFDTSWIEAGIAQVPLGMAAIVCQKIQRKSFVILEMVSYFIYRAKLLVIWPII